MYLWNLFDFALEILMHMCYYKVNALTDRRAGGIMHIFESMFYGIVSGFSEFLPVSSQAHQVIVNFLTGNLNRDPIRDLIVHIGMIVALFIAYRITFLKLYREQQMVSRSRRRKNHITKGFYELRLLRTACIAMMIGLFMNILTRRFEDEILYIALFMLINGVILLIPDYIRQANKSAREMSAFDASVMGISAAAASLPGISRIGIMHTYALCRGADKHQSLNWVLLLSLPALILLCVIDIFAIFSFGLAGITFAGLIGYLISGLFAGIGSYLAIILVRFLIVRSGFSGIAYYSLGTALFCLILYLIA